MRREAASAADAGDGGAKQAREQDNLTENFVEGEELTFATAG